MLCIHFFGLAGFVFYFLFFAIFKNPENIPVLVHRTFHLKGSVSTERSASLIILHVTVAEIVSKIWHLFFLNHHFPHWFGAPSLLALKECFGFLFLIVT